MSVVRVPPVHLLQGIIELLALIREQDRTDRFVGFETYFFVLRTELQRQRVVLLSAMLENGS